MHFHPKKIQRTEEQRQYCERQISLISKTTQYFCLLLVQQLLYENIHFLVPLHSVCWVEFTYFKSVITDNPSWCPNWIAGKYNCHSLILTARDVSPTRHLHLNDRNSLLSISLNVYIITLVEM